MGAFMPASGFAATDADRSASSVMPPVGMPHRDRPHPPLNLAQHGDFGEPTPTGAIPRDVQQHLDGRGELTVQRRPVETAERAQRLQPGGNFGGAVGVHRARAPVVAGVQRCQQIDHLGAPDLADHDAVGPHPQRLPDELAHRYFADAFDVGAPRDELHQMRMPGRQLGGILDAHDPFGGRHGAEHRREQGRLAGPGSAAHQEGQPGGDDVGDQGRGLGLRSRPRRSGPPSPGWPAAVPAATGRCPRPPRAAAPRAIAPRTPAPMPVSWPSTHGCASSSRRPAASASRCARPPHRRLVGEPNLAAPQAISVVDPHRVRRGNQDVGGAVSAQQRFEDAGAGQLGLQHPEIGQHLGVAEHPAGLGPDGGGHDVGPQRRPQRGGFGGQPLAHPFNQRTAHAALPFRAGP